MGGKSDTPNQPNIPAAASGFSGPAYPMTMPAGMPGQIQSVADSLNMGFGPPDQLSQLQNLYSPTQFKGFQNIPGLSGQPGGGGGGNAGAGVGAYQEFVKRMQEQQANGTPFEQQSSSLLPPTPAYDMKAAMDPANMAAMDAWLAPLLAGMKK